MTEILRHLRERKLVQWAIAYVAAAFAVLQGIDIVAQQFDWAPEVRRGITLLLGLGFFVALVLAWYHGERGRQRMSGAEVLILALLLAAGGGALWRFAPGTATAPATHAASTLAKAARTAAPTVAAAPIDPKSIAVLPFANMSDDKSNAYFADGMQDMILTKLADIGALKVISRTSTERYRSHPEDLKTIALQLGVAAILEGSVQKVGNQVLINVQLIDAATDEHLWAKAYTRTLDNIFGVEGEVAQKVADALKATLTPVETARVADVPTRNTAAYDAYLQGEYYTHRAQQSFVKADFDAAIRNYRDATREDPKFALAWAKLAIEEARLLANYNDDHDKIAKEAKAAVARALELAPDLAEAHLAQGYYRKSLARDLDGALASFQAAAALAPQDAQVWFSIAVSHQHRGQWAASIEAFQRASALDPRNLAVLNQMGVSYMFLRRYAESAQVFKRSLAIDPGSAIAVYELAQVDFLAGNLDGATTLLEGVPPATQANPLVIDQRANLALYRRDYAAARALYAQMKPGGIRSPQEIETDLGDLEWAAGNQPAAREHYQRALVQAEAALKESPDPNALGSEGLHAALGWLYAHLGRTREALPHTALAIKLTTSSKDFASAETFLTIAKVQAQLGQTAEAVATLDHLLAIPVGGWVSVPILKLDPDWDPIRHDPRFQALLTKYAKGEGTRHD